MEGRDSYRVVGRSRPLVEGREKVTGRTRYVGDLTWPGMLHARLVLSPYPHARVVAVEKDAALARPGVVAVVTAADLPAHLAPPTNRARRLLARDRALYRGEPVAVVLAESETAAADAVELVRVEYEPLPAVTSVEEAVAPGAPLVWPEGVPEDLGDAAAHGATAEGAGPSKEPSNVHGVHRLRRGDVEEGFRQSDVVVERTFRTSMVHHSYLEPHAQAALVDPATEEVIVHTATQGMFFVRREVAKTLGLPESRVRVVPHAVGGGFGGKIMLFEPLVAVLATLTRRPVRLVLTRGEELLATQPAPGGVFHVRVGARRDGTLTALDGRFVFDSGCFPGVPVAMAALLSAYAYRWQHVRLEVQEVLTNKPSVGAYRAPTAPQTAFAVESLVDEVARRLGMDPLDLRLANAVDEGDAMPDGSPWPKVGLRACLRRLREHPLWRERDRRPGRGYGVAVGGWPGGSEPASAACKVNGDGSLTVLVGSMDITGTHTTMAAIAAETFGVPPERVRVVVSDTEQAPYAGVAGGSKITRTVGLAVQRAAADARRQLLVIAADRLEARLEDLEIVDGVVRVRGVPGREVPVAEVAQLSMQFFGRYEPPFGRGASAIAERAPAFAAHLAEVEVDEETGAVRVLRQVVAQDVGFAINPATVEGQMLGGAVQGLGWALFERVVYDRSGQLLTGSLMDYAVPRAEDCPILESIIVEVPAPSGPFGARGVGEPPVIAGAAAIANAIRDATGARVTELPMTPERVLQALHADR